ncbi:hypothetical protein [Actomonas aquatica]|uniref:Uncharacterized protein n=1 Tax=Actomonas aquatica TaxID=2866162 RepID=A0ABZ1C3H7_9BACT|nr:hypothetical protein [Opitutus sp. WL0086]WRQ86234.1 hypothetical protein K1X11_015570 [Opitutus sp. WL0086]
MPISRFLLPVLAATLTLSASAQGLRNPFGRKAEATVAAPEQAAPVQDAQLQFVGTFGWGDSKQFLIYNVSKNRSFWVGLEEEGPDGEVVQAYDAESGAVQVIFNGQPLNLALQVATIAGGGARPPGPVPTAAQSSNALVNTVKVNPTPADERRRLEAVAAEVRRRRALRQQSKTNQNPGSNNR